MHELQRAAKEVLLTLLITTKSWFRDSVSVGMSKHCLDAARSLWDMANPWPARRAAPKASDAACERTGFRIIAAIIEPTAGEMNEAVALPTSCWCIQPLASIEESALPRSVADM